MEGKVRFMAIVSITRLGQMLYPGVSINNILSIFTTSPSSGLNKGPKYTAVLLNMSRLSVAAVSHSILFMFALMMMRFISSIT